MDIKVKKYSLGMKQKVGIVLSLIANPDIIILDEPTNSLDVTSVKRFHNLLKSIKDEKIIIISMLSKHALLSYHLWKSLSMIFIL